MLKKVLLLAATVLLLTGCGVNVRQEGNKIFTDISKDDAYAYTNAALKTKGYKVSEESKINYYIVAEPEFNQTFKVTDASKQEVRADIASDEAKNETVVTVVAMANGNIDEEKSKEIVDAAVQEIIAELDKYGKFTAVKDAEHVYPIATIETVTAYVKDYFTNNNISITTEEGAKLSVKEATATSPFNDPLSAEVSTVADETNKVTIKISAALAGNYDVKGNQQYTDDFINKFISYLDNYPVVEKGVRFAYKFITFQKAFNNTKLAIKDCGFTIDEINDKDFLITATKNGIKLSTTFTNINNNIAVNLEAFKEGKADEGKEALTATVTDELAKVQEALAKYQTIITTQKSFISSSQGEVLGFVQRALSKVGYKAAVNKADMTVSAYKISDVNRAHFIIINNLGTEGISLEINTMYNAASAKANDIAQAESDKLMAELAKFEQKALK